MRFFGLPDCDTVFMTYFDRWYSPEDRERKVFRATRPDVMSGESLRRASAKELSPLDEVGQAEVQKMVEGMITAAREDWPTFLSVSAPIDLDWIDAFDRYHDKRRIKQLMRCSKPEDFSNDFLVRCCEFGAVLGLMLSAIQPDLHWVYDWPYWESAVLDPQAGQIFPVFHWAMKKFSNYGIDDGFKAKLLACANLIEKERRGERQQS